MAKAPATVNDQAETKALVTTPVGGKTIAEPFFAPDEIEAMGGEGLDNVTAANVLLPRLTILQKLSPQLNKKKVEFIEGAQEGDWCDVGVGDIFRGSIEAIPCHFSTQYILWKKNRGGFGGNLGMDAKCLNDTTLNEKRQNILPSGDAIVETATWYCLLRVGGEWRRVFLPFTSTGLKVSRKWLTLIKAEKLLGKNGWFSAPLFYRPWTLNVLDESNEQGDWFTPVVNKIVTGDLSQYGLETNGAVTTGGASPMADRFKNIYHMMYENHDTKKELLAEARKFYEDARDNLVVGDLGTDDPNNPDNARSSNSVDNASTRM